MKESFALVTVSAVIAFSVLSLLGEKTLINVWLPVTGFCIHHCICCVRRTRKWQSRTTLPQWARFRAVARERSPQRTEIRKVSCLTPVYFPFWHKCKLKTLKYLCLLCLTRTRSGVFLRAHFLGAHLNVVTLFLMRHVCFGLITAACTIVKCICYVNFVLWIFVCIIYSFK